MVAGDDAGPPARQLAENARWPLLAEPSSGSRTGDSAIRTYRILLGGDLAARIERVVVFGHPTLSRPVTRLLGSGVEVVSVPPRGRWTERPHPVTRHARAVTADPDETGWFEEWKARDAEVSRALDDLVEADGLGPLAVAREVSAALPPGGQLYVGASNPIRDLDLMAAHYEVGRRRKVLANRGLSGIDGTVSSAIGAALTRPGARNLLLVGDVTFLHDMTALVIGPDEPRPDLTVVVVNDDGGSIFAVLEQGDPSYADRLRAPLRHTARRRPGRPVCRDPYAALAGGVGARAPSGAGQSQRRHRGGRGALPARQPAGARRGHPGAGAHWDTC